MADSDTTDSGAPLYMMALPVFRWKAGKLQQAFTNDLSHWGKRVWQEIPTVHEEAPDVE